MVADELLEFLDIFQLGLGFEDSLDITQMFFAAPFFAKNQPRISLIGTDDPSQLGLAEKS
jgi:hypothetical protein